MGNYSIQQLQEWNDRIEELGKALGLNCYPQEFEIVDYEEMMACEAYMGMPCQYPHWSFGKSYEKTRALYNHQAMGLPYELVINTNPCIAYLMKDNSLLQQILTMAHVYGHNDFFKNNRHFIEGTRPSHAVEMFKSHSHRARKYIQHPHIGYRAVEKILNGAHAIRIQISREPAQEPKGGEALLTFIKRYGRLESWERDLLHMVEEQARYFLPQIETKIINEGWATYWHYEILQRLKLPQAMMLEFLQLHHRIVQPHDGKTNPYHLGYTMLKDLEEKYGVSKLFEVRQQERDESFLRRYLTKECCRELNLLQYVKRGKEWEVKEVSDEQGWKIIREHMIQTTGVRWVPVIQVIEGESGGPLMLEHWFDGRELQLEHAYETLKHVVDLWGHKVLLRTRIQNTPKIIVCDENKQITIKGDHQ